MNDPQKGNIKLKNIDIVMAIISTELNVDFPLNEIILKKIKKMTNKEIKDHLNLN